MRFQVVARSQRNPQLFIVFVDGAKHLTPIPRFVRVGDTGRITGNRWQIDAVLVDF